MRRLFSLFTLACCLFVVAGLSRAAEDVSEQVTPLHEARFQRVDLNAQQLPIDLVSPEGRTRWEFGDLVVGRSWVRAISSIDEQAEQFEVLDKGTGVERIQLRTRIVRSDTPGDARMWLFPHEDPEMLAIARQRPLVVTQQGDDGTSTVEIDVRRVGMGWVILPSGPREVVLQRVVTYDLDGSGGRTATTLTHRWVDPRAGVVAEVSGPIATDGKTRTGVSDASVLDQVFRGQTPLKIFVDEIDFPIETRLTYGVDYGNPTAISSLTDPSFADIGSLAAAGTWNFKLPVTPPAARKIASMRTLVSAAETCNSDECGFNLPGVTLNREDPEFDTGMGFPILSIQEREDRANDSTIWLRAGTRFEGKSGGLTDGEARFCYTTNDTPLWQFVHQDGVGEPYYMRGPAAGEPNDFWSNAPFQCENVIFNTVCQTDCGFLCPVYPYVCGGEDGTQSVEVIGEGVITLPSGHSFNSLLARNLVSYCTGLGSTCGINFQTVHLQIYLWVVPNIGTVARLGTVLNEQNPNFTSLEDTDIKFGIFPPVSITNDGVADTTIEISWDPGEEPYASGDAQNPDATEIDSFRIYWDTDSGMADGSYAFDSQNHPGQVSFGPSGRTATISGLTAGTDYYVTVTSVEDYTSPSSGTTFTFESVLFPMSIPGGATPVPVELLATTTGGACLPVEEVLNLRVNPSGADTEFCWDAVSEPCVDSYELLQAIDPSGAGNFSALMPDSAGNICLTRTTTEGFFLIRSIGGSSRGPLGHFGQ